ncbi:MAG: hypothetical protein AB9873_17330 [Syntrophobacteraceae bacterium]
METQWVVITMFISLALAHAAIVFPKVCPAFAFERRRPRCSLNC